MKHLLLAIQFLTIAPIQVAACEQKDLGRSLAFFPLVGLLIGLALWLGLALCAALRLGEMAYAIVPIVALATLTGGLHLDGLSDTADGILSRRNREETLAIMRDPHAGALGICALVCCLLLKIAFLAGIPLEVRGKALVLACVAARWPLVLSMHSFPYARKEGKARPFVESVNGKILLSAAAVTVLICTVVAGWKGLLALATITLCVLAFNRALTRKLGGITGDTLGASVELSEMFALFLTQLIL